MDAIVLQAITKWPDVPACYGWLGLDSRGRWYVRDAVVQSAGPFALRKGARLEHSRLLQFIQRNYAADPQGCWYFQNGPQRVYVELEATPYIWRIASGLSVTAQTGQPARLLECLSDQEGKVYLNTDLGFGLVHSLDVELVAQALEERRWTLKDVDSQTLDAQYGFVRSPEQFIAKMKPST